MRLFSTTYVTQYYGVTRQTVARWAEEFREYMSPHANPGDNKKREFTAQDMEVLDFVATSRDENFGYSEIHASLQSGQRGTAPQIDPQELQALSSSADTRLELEMRVEQMQRALLDAHKALQKAETELAQLKSVEGDNIRLKAQLEGEELRRKEADARIKELTARIEDLSKEVGREYTKGFMEGLKYRSSDEGEES